MIERDWTLPRALGRIYAGMRPRRRLQFWLIIVLMMVGAFFEMVTIGAVLPFLAAISNSTTSSSPPLNGELVRALDLAGGGAEWGAAIFLALMAITSGFVRLALVWSSQKFIYRIGHDLSVGVYAGVLRQPYEKLVQRNSSEIIAGVEKVHSVLASVLTPAMQGLVSCVLGFFIIFALCLVSPSVALISALSVGAVYCLLSFVGRKQLRSTASVLSEMVGRRIKALQEGLGGIRDIIIDQTQEVFLNEFRSSDLKFRDAQTRSAFISAAPRFIVEAAAIILFAALALSLSYGPSGMIGALPVLGALALGAQRLLPLLQNLYHAWSSLIAYSHQLYDVLDLVEAPVTSHEPVAGDVHWSFIGKIEFDSVSYIYSGSSEPALRNVDCTVHRGQRIGIIGKTGSGKSTFVDLLMGLLTPTRGAIRIDGRILEGAMVSDWQRQIAHVPQAIYLSDDTIAANIAFGVSSDRVSFERVRAAATTAELDEFVMTLPHGYDTLVGERGVRLSGGQRQRIGIARALYKRAKVLILDEATSALDSETEAAVMTAIQREDPGLTILIIAHRLSTLAECDMVMRLQSGMISQSGSYADVAGMSSQANRR